LDISIEERAMSDYAMWAGFVIAGLCTLTGCAAGGDILGEHEPGTMLLVSLGGVGGENVGTHFVGEGLTDAGVPCRVVAYPWSRGAGGLFFCDLSDIEGNRRIAAELADTLCRFRDMHPAVPLVLVGHSGGTAMVVFTLEALPEGVAVDHVFLLGPAFSPAYNLAPALRHVRGHVLSTSSPADFVVLGLGTRVFGTMDRRHEQAAGKVGLRLPENLSAEDRAEYRKVRQARWSWPWLLEGHYGGHFAWSTPWFAKQYIAPVLLGEAIPDIYEPVLAPEP
jgi:pimeloyl-ACP methyl ester carboxylesterase